MEVFRNLLVIVCFEFVRGRATVTPKNIAVVAGQKTSFECKIDNRSTFKKWEVQKASNEFSTDNIVTFRNKTMSRVYHNLSHFGVDFDDADGSETTLYVNSTRLSDGGNYSCVIYTDKEEKDIARYSAQLIVLESLPQCNEQYIGGRAEMSCSVNFSGFWHPTMEWKQVDSEGNAQITDMNNVVNTVVSKSYTSSTLNITIQSVVVGHDTFFFTCKTFFERNSTKGLMMNAINVPDFVYAWNSSVFPSYNSSTSSEATELPERIPWITYGVLIFLGIFVLLLVIGGYIFCHKPKKTRRLTDAPLRVEEGRYYYELEEAAAVYDTIELSKKHPSNLTDCARGSFYYLNPISYQAENPCLNDEPWDSLAPQPPNAEGLENQYETACCCSSEYDFEQHTCNERKGEKIN